MSILISFREHSSNFCWSCIIYHFHFMQVIKTLYIIYKFKDWLTSYAIFVNVHEISKNRKIAERTSKFWFSKVVRHYINWLFLKYFLKIQSFTYNNYVFVFEFFFDRIENWLYLILINNNYYKPCKNVTHSHLYCHYDKCGIKKMISCVYVITWEQIIMFWYYK